MLIETRVLIVEDHSLLAQSLRYALVAEGFLVDVADLDAPDAIVETARMVGADIVLLDLDLGGDCRDGVALVAPLRAQGAQVLVVSGTSDSPRLARCLELGAVGVLPKTAPLERLVAAVVDIAAGRRVTSECERVTRLTELRAWRTAEQRRLKPFERLTRREAEVLAAMMDGQSCDAMAGSFFVSEATVRTQIRGVLTKLEVGTQLAAVATAQRAGWSLS